MPCNKKSPGPADFTLKPLIGFKNHDFNSQKRRAPEWTIPGRYQANKNNITPGVIDIGPFNRFGKFPKIGGSMFQRYNEKKSTIAPGPASYNAVPSTMYRWPYDSKFTIGLKSNLPNINAGGPLSEITPLNVYKNRSPKYPMFAKTSDFKQSKSPGPSDYEKSGNNKLKMMHNSPAYTIRARLVGTPNASKPRVGASPASYNLMDYNPFARSPSHHIAAKHANNECVGVYILPQDNC